jgi:nitroreductase
VSWPVPYWYVDAGAAMMLILLAAIEEGLAACFVGNPDQEAILRELLGLPDDVVPIGVVLIGSAAEDPNADALTSSLAERRRPREQVVKGDRWTD